MSDASPQLNCYKPSGAFPIGGAILTLAGSAVLGVVLGAVYAFANYHDPLVYINVLLAGCFGLALGWTVAFGVGVFHIRNGFAAAAIGLVAFALAYVSHFVFYLAVLCADNSWNVVEIFGIARSMVSLPDEALELLKVVNERGVWSLGKIGSSRGTEVRGIFLTLVWVAEAIVIAFGAITAPLGRAGRPYSERRGAWLEPAELPKRINYIEDFPALAAAASSGNYSALATPWSGEPEGDQGEAARYAKATLYADASEAYISLTNVTESPKKKKKDAKSETVVKYWKIPVNAALEIKSALS